MEFYQAERADVENSFRVIFREAEVMAQAKGDDIEKTKPRTAGRQKHRANAPANTSEDYYRRNVAIPFLDHLCNELGTQFTGKVCLI